MVVLNADQIGESGRSLRELCQSDKLSIVVLKKCLAILHRLVITIYALLKMFSFNFQCFSESIVSTLCIKNHLLHPQEYDQYRSGALPPLGSRRRQDHAILYNVFVKVRCCV